MLRKHENAPNTNEQNQPINLALFRKDRKLIGYRVLRQEVESDRDDGRQKKVATFQPSVLKKDFNLHKFPTMINDGIKHVEVQHN